MIKLKDLLNEVGMGPTSNKDEETITIKHKTSEKEIVIVDTLKNRKKYTKMGYIIPLPKHLQKLIKDLEKRDKEFQKYGVEVTDVIVPGLEWMNDIPEGVVKKETQQLNEAWTKVKFDDIKVGTQITYQMKVVYIVTKVYPGGFLMRIYKDGNNPGMFAPKARIEKDNFISQVKVGLFKKVKK